MKKKWKTMGIVFVMAIMLVFSNHNIVSAATTDNVLVANVITDEALFNAVCKAYNTAKGESKTKTNFRYADLRSLDGILDLSGATSVKEIPEKAFDNCNFTKVVLPNSVTTIGANAFQDCSSLEEINLTDNITKLGEQAFTNCEKLTTFNSNNTLPKKLTSVGNNVFANDKALKSIILSLQGNNPNVFESATGIFQNCTALEKITIGSGVAKIPVSAFVNAGTSEGNTGVVVTFSKDFVQVLASAFEGVTFAKDSTIDFSQCNALAGIGARAFYKSKNLTKVILPKTTSNNGGVTLGAAAFAKRVFIVLFVHFP